MLKDSTIEAEFFCGCWFEFKNSSDVTQSCMYHNKKLVMRSDVRKNFDSPISKAMPLDPELYADDLLDKPKKRKKR